MGPNAIVIGMHLSAACIGGWSPGEPVIPKGIEIDSLCCGRDCGEGRIARRSMQVLTTAPRHVAPAVAPPPLASVVITLVSMQVLTTAPLPASVVITLNHRIVESREPTRGRPAAVEVREQRVHVMIEAPEEEDPTCPVHQRPSEAIREVIRGHQRSSGRSSEAIRGHQRPSEAIREVIRGHQGGHQRPSEAIRGRQLSISTPFVTDGAPDERGHQRASEAISAPSSLSTGSECTALPVGYLQISWPEWDVRAYSEPSKEPM